VSRFQFWAAMTIHEQTAPLHGPPTQKVDRALEQTTTGGICRAMFRADLWPGTARPYPQPRLLAGPCLRLLYPAPDVRAGTATVGIGR
jgi:hypothetical protein